MRYSRIPRRTLFFSFYLARRSCFSWRARDSVLPRRFVRLCAYLADPITRTSVVEFCARLYASWIFRWYRFFCRPWQTWVFLYWFGRVDPHEIWMTHAVWNYVCHSAYSISRVYPNLLSLMAPCQSHCEPCRCSPWRISAVRRCICMCFCMSCIRTAYLESCDGSVPL